MLIKLITYHITYLVFILLRGIKNNIVEKINSKLFRNLSTLYYILTSKITLVVSKLRFTSNFQFLKFNVKCFSC
jgi:hypothetical protein